MTKNELKVLKKVINLGDDSCTRTCVHSFTYSIKGEFLRKEKTDYYSLDETDAAELQTTVGMCLSGTLGKTINEYPIFGRVYAEDECTANTVRDLYEYARENGMLNDEIAQRYADAVAAGLIEVPEGKKSVIPTNRGITAYTVHMMCVKVNPALCEKKQRKSKANAETVEYAYNRAYLFTWVDTIATEHAKTLVEQEDGTTKMVRVDRPVVSTKPIVSVLYPTVTDGEIDRSKMVFYSKNNNDSFIHFVRRTYDCDVRPTGEQLATRYDTLMEEMSGGIMTFNFKTNIYDSIVDYKESFPGPKMSELQVLRTFDAAGISATARFSNFRQFYKDMFGDNEPPIDEIISRPHKIEIPSINGKLTFQTNERISDYIRVEDGEMGAKWLCVKVADAQVVYDDVPVLMVDDTKFYGPCREQEMEIKDDDAYGIARIEELYNKFKTDYAAVTQIDYKKYEKMVQKRRSTRASVITKYKRENAEEVEARKYVRDKNGKLTYKPDKEHNRLLKRKKERAEMWEATRNIRKQLEFERTHGLETYEEFTTPQGNKVMLPSNVGEYMNKMGVEPLNSGLVDDQIEYAAKDAMPINMDEVPPASYEGPDGTIHLNF